MQFSISTMLVAIAGLCSLCAGWRCGISVIPSDDLTVPVFGLTTFASLVLTLIFAATESRKLWPYFLAGMIVNGVAITVKVGAFPFSLHWIVLLSALSLPFGVLFASIRLLLESEEARGGKVNSIVVTGIACFVAGLTACLLVMT